VKSIVTRRLRTVSAWLALVVAAAPAFAQADRPIPSAVPPPALTAASQQPPLPAAERSFFGLFRQIGRDLRDFPQREHLAWLGIGAGLSLAGHRADRNVTRTLSTSVGVQAALEPGRVVGGAMAQLAGAVATYGMGRLTNAPAVARLGSDLIRAGVLSQTLTQAVKLTARRTRPDGDSFSFPSGHTASAFASATVLERHYGWKAGVPAYAVASYIAASRLSENRHFLSDVIFGATIGIVAGRTVTIGHGASRFALAPLVTPRGAGVALVKTGSPR
jgi:membrane-associated phospholipid phosphatase